MLNYRSVSLLVVLWLWFAPAYPETIGTVAQSTGTSEEKPKNSDPIPVEDVRVFVEVFHKI